MNGDEARQAERERALAGDPRAQDRFRRLSGAMQKVAQLQPPRLSWGEFGKLVGASRKDLNSWRTYLRMAERWSVFPILPHTCDSFGISVQRTKQSPVASTRTASSASVDDAGGGHADDVVDADITRTDPKSAAKEGNSTKRVRLAARFDSGPDALASLVGGHPLEGDFRSMQRLPADVLKKATPEFIWAAVQKLQAEGVEHPFSPSTDFDLIADDGGRLPPKAVFGVALSMALGGLPIGPKHFSAGDTSPCFRLLRAAGYQVVRKGEVGEPVTGYEEEDEDGGTSEGKVRLVSHRKRERGAGLAKAKKAQFLREHGKLSCERCGLDPVSHYGTVHAQACIEVHHAATQVSEMQDGHKTKLKDLQCLCANCHRLVHRALRAGESLQ